MRNERRAHRARDQREPIAGGAVEADMPSTQPGVTRLSRGATSGAAQTRVRLFAMTALALFGDGCAERANAASAESPALARVAADVLVPTRAINPLMGASSLMAGPATEATPAPWSVAGASIRFRSATVAADGEGAWQIHVVADIAGTSSTAVTVDDRHLLVAGSTDPLERSGSRAIRLRAGESVRRDLGWRMLAAQRPRDVQLVWLGTDAAAAPAVHTLPLAEVAPIHAWTRVLRSAVSPVRVAVVGVDENIPPYAQPSIRVRVTITNAGDEPILIPRSAFEVRVQNPREETLTPTSTAVGYNPALTYCQMGMPLVPEQNTLRPGESVSGALCFTRTARDHVSIVQVSMRRNDRVEFSGIYPLAS
jgi:hypothetical protein